MSGLTGQITGASTFMSFIRMEVAPASGSTTSFFSGNINHVLFTNGTTTAAQTVALPLNPVDGKHVMISNVSAITALTLVPTVPGAMSGLIAGQGLWLMYSKPLASWIIING